MRLNFEEAEMLNRNWVLNTFEGIDEPGEWAVLDGWIYLYPETRPEDIRVPTLTSWCALMMAPKMGIPP